MSQPNSNFLKGVAFAKAQNYSEALKSFTSAIEEHPNKFTSYLNRGSIECCLGLDQFAIEDFNKVVELEPYQITGYYNRFISFYKTGKKLQARHDLYVALSLAYMKKGEELRQVGLIGKALDIVENNSLALIKRGNLYKQQGNIEMAINDYTGALDADDKNLVALTLRAPLLKNTGRQEQAEEDVQRIAQLTSNFERNKIVLFPRINTLTPSQIETDIQTKVKQFTSLRNEIFKKGLEQSIRNEANETKYKPKSTNKLQTTLNQRTEQVVDPERVQKASNKDSLGHLADFVQSSQNVNSSNQMLNESGVERVQYRAPVSNVLTEEAGASNTQEQTPVEHVQYTYQQSKQITQKPIDSIEIQTQQNAVSNTQPQNEQLNDNQHQEYTVQVIQTSQSRQNRQQPTQQTGDDMYGVEPHRQSKQLQNDVNVEEDYEVKRSLGVSQTVDNVKSSQDNEFINIGRQENADNNQNQNQKQDQDQDQDQDQKEINNDNDQNENIPKQQQEQQIEYKQQPKQIITYEPKKQQNDKEQEQQIKYTNEKEHNNQQLQVITIDNEPTVCIAKNQDIPNPIIVSKNSEEQNQNKDNQITQHQNKDQNQHQKQNENEKQIEYVQNVKVIQSVDYNNNQQKQNNQQNQEQKQNDQNNKIQSDKQQNQPQEQEDQQPERQIRPKGTSKPWWEESESSKIEDKQILESKQNQGQQQNNNQKELEEPSEDLSSIKNQPNNQSKSQDPNSNLLSLDNSQTQQNKQELHNQHQEEEGKAETDQKPQTLNFLKQDPSNNIQQIDSFELINSKTSGLGNTDRDNQNKQQNNQDNRENQNNENNDEDTHGQLLRDIQEIKQDVKNQLKNVNSIQYKLVQSQSIQSKDSEDTTNNIRDQINNARLVESKMDVPEEQEHHQHDQEQVQTVKTSNLQTDTNIQTSQNVESNQKIEIVQTVEGPATVQTTQIIQTSKGHESSQIIQVPSQIKKLQILILSANILRNTEWLGKMSPFVTILYNGWEQNTEVADKAGNIPEWNQVCNFNYDDKISALTFQMYDKQTFKNDDLIGQVTLNLKDLKGKKSIELFFEEQLAAQLTIQLTIKQ